MYVDVTNHRVSSGMVRAASVTLQTVGIGVERNAFEVHVLNSGLTIPRESVCATPNKVLCGIPSKKTVFAMKRTVGIGIAKTKDA